MDPDKINFATSSMTSELPVSCRRLPGRCTGGRAEPGGPAAGGGRARLQDCRAHRQAAQEEGPRVLPQENPLRRENCPLLVPLLQVRSLIEEKKRGGSCCYDWTTGHNKSEQVYFQLCYFVRFALLCDDATFRCECPNGKLSRAHLLQLFTKVFPTGNAQSFCNHIFRWQN